MFAGPAPSADTESSADTEPSDIEPWCFGRRASQQFQTPGLLGKLVFIGFAYIESVGLNQ